MQGQVEASREYWPALANPFEDAQTGAEKTRIAMRYDEALPRAGPHSDLAPMPNQHKRDPSHRAETTSHRDSDFDHSRQRNVPLLST